MTVETLMQAAFYHRSEKRSDAYKAGMKSIFERCLNGKKIPCQFREGTAEFDAYLSGVCEGLSVYPVISRGER